MPHINPGVEIVHSPTRIYWLGTSEDDLIIYDGSIYGGDGNDTLIAAAEEGSGQIHLYGQEGSDILSLAFKGRIDTPSYGHHAWGELRGVPARVATTYRFTDTENIVAGGVVVGRLQDFDPSRDRLVYENRLIDLADLPPNMRIVSYNGNHTDEHCDPQQWLLIETARGGYIFYALDGYRVDMSGQGGSGEHEQEIHFIDLQNLPDFMALPEVDYVDPINYVPADYEPLGAGIIINDHDDNIAEVLEVILGTNAGDLIAGGLNDDTVRAGGGRDRAWGGDGCDVLAGEDHDDTLVGGSCEDMLFGGSGNDQLAGERGADWLGGGADDDMIWGGGSGDMLFGAGGDDTAVGGGGNDLIDSGRGDDRLTGGEGADVFVFDDSHGTDRIADFSPRDDGDRLDLRGLTGLNRFGELRAMASQVGDDVVIATGASSSVILENLMLDDLTAGDFIF